MYGLVNRAIEQMVSRNHGSETWERVRREADISTEVFISNQPYPDSVTYQLVAAATRVLGLPADQILQDFGRFWILHTALESYGPLMRMTGRSVADFLAHLPAFHHRVKLVYPDLSPPEFCISNAGPCSLHLHYCTSRPAGLEPFVEGLLDGIGRMFDTSVTVQIVADRRAGAPHSIFAVSWSQSPRPDAP